MVGLGLTSTDAAHDTTRTDAEGSRQRRFLLHGDDTGSVQTDRLTKFIKKKKKDVSVGEVSTRFGKGVKMSNVSSSSSTSNSDDVIWNQTLTGSN